MKLRITPQQIRIRIDQEDLATLKAQGTLKDCLELGPAPGQKWCYGVRVTEAGAELSLNLADNTLQVFLPRTLANQWFDTDLTGFSQVQQLPDPAAVVEVLLEKDFQCLHKKETPSSRAFPHPSA